MKVKSEREVTRPCPTLSDPLDCSPPGSSVHGILQARRLEWAACPPLGSSRPGDRTRASYISCTAGGAFSFLLRHRKPIFPYAFALVYLSCFWWTLLCVRFSLLKHASLKENTKRWVERYFTQVAMNVNDRNPVWQLRTASEAGRPRPLILTGHETPVKPWGPA